MTDVPHNVEHFTIFFVTGVAFNLGYNKARQLLLAIALVIFAGVIELAQLLSPGRHARLSDFVVDAFALCLGVGLASILTTWSQTHTS
ncbi:MAG: VanZ family protein [Xanthobacteraceae bacterium]